MPLQTLTAPPTAPVRGSDSETFITAAEANIAWWSTHVSEQNTLSAQLMATSALIAVAPDYADPTLLAIASSGLTIAADRFVYFNGASTALLGTVTSFGRSFMDDVDATAGRSTLGLGTIATQSAASVAITGGSVTGITDITVADGGTGASTASGARTNLGLDPIVVPTGAVFAFAMNAPPTGYLECDGTAVSRTTYADLFAAIGTTFGVGDGSTTFNLPELRGEFVRGWDNGRGVDTARAFGSAQADELKAHTHTYNKPVDTTSGAPGGNGGFDQSNNTGSTGGTETRPRNIALLYGIKT